MARGKGRASLADELARKAEWADGLAAEQREASNELADLYH